MVNLLKLRRLVGPVELTPMLIWHLMTGLRLDSTMMMTMKTRLCKLRTLEQLKISPKRCRCVWVVKSCLMMSWMSQLPSLLKQSLLDRSAPSVSTQMKKKTWISRLFRIRLAVLSSEHHHPPSYAQGESNISPGLTTPALIEQLTTVKT